ncbi:hypothetical protein [Porphyrobacter sp. LM 6]|uniref:hypothetical protein n=1 Tax=Porphyrobacter sp. LM 6 TaxID=1896196 RepID=UPI000863C0A7|nr:hypothetical protein [Porphyrobacter sp. LM 6]AOL94497.1 hypothetical protein BG023_111569 [Porphyrobacter sp. LM 6]
MTDHQSALKLIQQLEWEKAAPDGSTFEVRRSLSEVINQLAFEGFANPSKAVLDLLADGQLRAVGLYHWESARLEHFSGEGSGVIPQSRWQKIRQIQQSKYRFLKVSFVILDFEGEQPFVWDWQRDHVTYATVSEGLHFTALEYEEDYFYASEIEIQRPEVATTSNSGSKNTGGRPRVYEWERAVAAVALSWGNTNWEPTKPADVAERLLEWFSKNGQEPANAAVKPYAKMLFEEIQAVKD